VIGPRCLAALRCGVLRAAALATAALLAGCWPQPLVRRDAADVQDAAPIGPGDLGLSFLALAPCVSEVDYTSGSTTIEFGGSLGTRFSPNCLIVHTGTIVTFSGAFSEHPLRPSERATGPSPIIATSQGTVQQFAFTAAGFYPYYCARHGDDGGGGMSGVIEVVP